MESGGELSETEARHSVAKRCKLVWLWREFFRDAERRRKKIREEKWRRRVTSGAVRFNPHRDCF